MAARVLEPPAEVFFLCSKDVTDRRAWSGIPHRMHQEFLKDFPGAQTLSPLGPSLSFLRMRNLLRRLGLKGVERGWFVESDWGDYQGCFQRRIGRQLGRKMRPEDVLFSLFPDAAVARPDYVKWIFFSDATFRCLRELYFPDRAFSPLTLRSIERTWRRSSSADMAIFTSHWAAESAIRDYGFSRERTTVIPLGANFVAPEGVAWSEIARERLEGPCRLLWMGSDWKRKRGDLVVSLAEALRMRGMEVEVDMVGEVPASGVEGFPEYVRHHGKRYPEHDREFLEKLFLQARWFVLPSKGDCTPVVFSEAASFALPALGTLVGGTEDSMSNGQSGWLFPLEGWVDSAAEKILEQEQQPESYQNHCKMARDYYEQVGNWKTFSAAISCCIRRIAAR